MISMWGAALFSERETRRSFSFTLLSEIKYRLVIRKNDRSYKDFYITFE